MTQTVIAVPNPSGTTATLWRLAQLLGVVLTAVLLAGLVVRPELALDLLWNVAVPVLPAVFLVNPLVWRNICPLATLNKLTGTALGSRQLAPRAATVAGAVGITLLYVMVPARRFLFNVDGPVLGATIVAVALLALVGGALYSVKGGFCNSICPVLPVERLYGQRPLVDITNARCSPCTLCTARGCLDLAPRKSIAQTLGAARRSRKWVFTPYGAFAASFPGFVYGYFQTVDGALATAPAVYGTVLGWAAVSFVLVAVVSVMRPGKNHEVIMLVAAVAIGLYYWFASPTLAEALALPSRASAVFRAVALGLVATWIWRGFPNGS